MNQKKRRIATTGCLWVLLFLLAPGCQQMIAWKKVKMEMLPIASAENPVHEVICLWEPGEGTGLDGLPCRGFVGKVMFFAHGIDPPVRVEGDVRVYMFDDQGSAEEQQHPIHQFNFDSKAFQAFLSETNVGAAYQFFLPYTRSGAHRAACSLRLRLTPPDGRPVYSKMGTLILPGTTRRTADKPIAEISEKVNEGIQLVLHESVSPTSASGKAQLPDATSSLARNAGIDGDDRVRLKSALSHLTSGSTPALTAVPVSQPTTLGTASSQLTSLSAAPVVEPAAAQAAVPNSAPTSVPNAAPVAPASTAHVLGEALNHSGSPVAPVSVSTDVKSEVPEATGNRLKPATALKPATQSEKPPEPISVNPLSEVGSEKTSESVNPPKPADVHPLLGD